MPVRYDIAGQIPQYSGGGGFDPVNMMAQLQTMDYRQRQNALAEMQMAEYARKMQAMQSLRGLTPNFSDPRFAQQAWQYDPETSMQVQNVIRQSKAQEATEAAQRAAAGYHTGMLGLAREEQRLKTPKLMAEGREATGKAAQEDIKSAQRLLAPAYMTRTPEAFEAQYAQVYNDLPDAVRKRLGARPDMAAVEAIMATPEIIAERQKPVVRKPGETITYGTGRAGETIETEPVFQPNALAAPAPPPANALVDRNRMPAIANEVTQPLSPEQQIIQRSMNRRALLGQVPPEDRPKVQSQLDLAETIQAANSGFDRLAQAGGIPVAGQATAENWKAKARSTKAGMAIGNLSDSQVAEEINNLKTIAGIMRQRMAGAIGLTARQMDAAKEMEAFEKIVGGEPSAEGLASAKQRLNTINQLLGTGEAQKFESPRSRGKAGEAPAADDLDAILGIKR